MCGIIGYIGHRPAVPVLLEGLARLEYRGYDSAGVAFIQDRALHVLKSEGKLSRLRDRLAGENVYTATCGIGHTRWATHGPPIERNAHPHADNPGHLALVHNGIIENYAELKYELQERGYKFVSDTDTEVIAHLLRAGLDEELNLLESLALVMKRVEGSYALVIIDLDNPGRLAGARKHSPLILGLGVGESFVASDIPAFLPYTNEVIFLEDGEMFIIEPDKWEIFSPRYSDPLEFIPMLREPKQILWDFQAAQKGGYKHFMLKEIFEQPRVISDCLAGRIFPEADDLGAAKEGMIRLPELEDFPLPERLTIVACGTSYHAGLWGKYIIESLAGVPVSVETASEFRYREPVLGPEDVVLAISQSGETADTLAGIKLAQERGSKVIGLCNVLGSTVARISDKVIFTQAGPEISVASTKALCSQLTLLYLLALLLAGRKGRLGAEALRKALLELRSVPGELEKCLDSIRQRAAELVPEYSRARNFLYLGRGYCYPLALEGALKLKEISYIHAEGYPAGEMKHGPIALVDQDFPTFALAPGLPAEDSLFSKVKANLAEIASRNGKIIVLACPDSDLALDAHLGSSLSLWEMPLSRGFLNTFFLLPATQLFAYEMADYLGKDVDQPRNLAKSVTVE